MHELVVLYFKKPLVNESQIDFLFLSTTNLFVASISYFIAD